jgi:hypothetical protein
VGVTTARCFECGSEYDGTGCFDCAQTWRGGLTEYHETGTLNAELPPSDEPGSGAWADALARSLLRDVDNYAPVATEQARRATAILWVCRVMDRLRG